MRQDKAKEKFIRGTARDQGYKHAARFLIACEKTSLKNILPFLSQEELICIIREVIKINTFTQKDAKKILNEFGVEYELLENKYPGGVIKARNMLNESLGEEIGTKLLSQIISCQKR